jgi:uncharacterized membrane protein
MHLAFDILRGLGVAAAIGIRPFLPALAACALASDSVEIHFHGTGLSFLGESWFLLVLVVGAIVLSLVERRLGLARLHARAGSILLGAVSAALGALLFAGILEQGHYVAWPGVLGGIACALVGALATRPILERTRRRLDEGAQAALPLYAESAGLVLSLLSVLAPPVGGIALAELVWLLIASRRRAGKKYAGLRILR